MQTDSTFQGGTTLNSGTVVNVTSGKKRNLSGSVSGGQFNPGNTMYLDGATLSGTTLNAGDVVVQGTSTLSGTNTSAANIQINDGQTLKMAGTPSLSNTGTITVGTDSGAAAALNNADTSHAATLSGGHGGAGGKATDALSAIGAYGFISDNLIRGAGTISAPLTNNGTLTASGAGKTLAVNGAVSGSGNVNVGADASDTVTMALASNLAAKDFTLNQSATLNQTAGTITLTGNFTNYATSTTQWQPSAGINLSMTGSTFEVGGNDYGAVTGGFTSNFNLASLTVTGSLSLLEAIDNGNRNGPHGSAEALYVGSLFGPSEGTATLDLNHLWLYINNGGAPIALGDGVYGGNLTVTNSPVPLPGAMILLVAGLARLAVYYRRRNQVQFEQGGSSDAPEGSELPAAAILP